MTMSLEQWDRIKWAVLVAGLPAGCLLACGCLAFDPGGQVRRAAQHRQELGWNSEGNFTAEVFGTQRNFLLMEEEALTYDDEGRVTSRTTYKVESRPEHAETEAAFTQSTAQMEFIVPPMTQVLMRLADLIEKLAAPDTEPEPAPEPP